MKPKLIAILLLIVLVPLGLMTWLGLRITHDEQDRVQERYQQVLQGRLDDINHSLVAYIEETERSFLKLSETSTLDPEKFRELIRGNRNVRQIFVLGKKGQLTYPSLDVDKGGKEAAFFQRTASIWSSGEKFYNQGESDASTPREYGWHTWFWGEGVNIIFWRHDESGEIIGIELERMAMMSDIVGILPASGYVDRRWTGRGVNSTRVSGGRIVLCNAADDPIYQWGDLEVMDADKLAVTVPVAAPLNMWSLKYYVPSSSMGEGIGGGTLFSMISGLGAMGIMLVVLALYFYRESSREMNEAEQRVSFVNQVSHELKTPLTNIRLYAELLEQSVDEKDVKALERMGVIVSESQRLSRLINNVLSFAKKQKDGVSLRLKEGIVDDVVAAVNDSFRLSFQEKDVSLEIDTRASGQVKFDADVLEQILGNIFSNAEKYAVSGKHLAIKSRQDGDMTTITVADKGPGIPAQRAEAIFAPFTRLSNKLTDGVTGTGIGLSIARDLARLHGGDLVLLSSEEGACFELTFRTW